MEINSGISVLPFYIWWGQGLPKQRQHHRKWYAFGNRYPLVTDQDSLLPFQIIVPHAIRDYSNLEFTVRAVSRVQIFSIDSSGNERLYDDNLRLDYDIKKHDNCDIIRYNGADIGGLPEPIKCGFYYLVIEIALVGSNGKESHYLVYSDVFNVTDNLSDYLRLKYRNTYDLVLNNGIVDFSDNFSFYFYIPATIGKPEYVFEEEASERMGETFIECQMSKKVYKFVFPAPEYVCDALRVVRLCDYKELRQMDDIVQSLFPYNLTTFDMEVSWETQGDLASVECSFETDTVVSTVGGFMPVKRVGVYKEDYDIR